MYFRNGDEKMVKIVTLIKPFNMFDEAADSDDDEDDSDDEYETSEKEDSDHDGDVSVDRHQSSKTSDFGKQVSILSKLLDNVSHCYLWRKYVM